MKVVQIAESFCYGTAKSVKQLCTILKENHEVTVYYGHRDGTDVELAQLAPDVRWVSLPGHGFLGHFSNMWFLLRNVEAEVEVIHGHSTIGGAYAKALSVMFRKARVFYSPRGYSFLRLDFSARLRTLFRWFEMLTAPLCTTIACGPAEMRIAKKIARSPVEIGNGWTIEENVDTQVVGDGIVAVGRISIQKGFDIFLQVARRLPQTQFLWIGSAESGQTQLMQNLPSNVTIESCLPHQELLQKVANCRFVLLPSRWEGLSRFLVESACAGKAIVTSHCPSNVDCLVPPATEHGQYANGFSCETADQYVHAIETLSQDDELVRSMQAASLQLARNEFDIVRISQKWHELYSRSRITPGPLEKDQMTRSVDANRRTTGTIKPEPPFKFSSLR